METAFSPEKPKRKNDALPARGNPDLAYGLMFAASLVMVFFQLDNLIGAVGLRTIYFWVSLGATAIVILWLIKEGIGVVKGIAHSIMIMGLVTFFLCSVCSPVFYMTILRNFPPTTPLIMFGIATLQWILLRKPMRTNINKLIPYMMGFLIICILYWVAVGTKNITLSYAGSVYYQNHYYALLDDHNSFADTPDHTLTLYECNAVAIACKSIFSDTRFFLKTVALQADNETHNLYLALDDANVFTHHLKN
jgi:hypothetical protein